MTSEARAGHGASSEEMAAFLRDACRELGLDLTSTEPGRFRLKIPPAQRRHFGNNSEFNLTTLEELKQIDPDLELIGPGSYLLERLSSLLAARPACTLLVTDPPPKIDLEAALRGFDERFISGRGPADEHRAGTLPSSWHISSARQSVRYRPYLRIVYELEIRGRGSPVHETFPIHVDLEAAKIVKSPLLGRRMYSPEETGLLARERLPFPDKERLFGGIDIAQAEMTAILRSLAAEVWESVDVSKLREERERKLDWLRNQAAQDSERRVDLERKIEEVEKSPVRGKLAPRASIVSVAVIHETLPELSVELMTSAGRHCRFPIPLIPGRHEIPDDVVVCGHRKARLVAVPDQGLVCDRCALECSSCLIGVRRGAGACRLCAASGQVSCADCVSPVSGGFTACSAHSFVCAAGEAHLRGAERPCDACQALTCPDRAHRIGCSECDRLYCKRCAPINLAACGGCVKWMCASHLEAFPERQPRCADCISACSVDGARRPTSDGARCGASGEKHWTCRDHLATTSCGHGDLCPEHRVITTQGNELVCLQCVITCSDCTTTVRLGSAASCATRTCKAALCAEHAGPHACAVCGATNCGAHRVTCSTTAVACCPVHSAVCASCNKPFRSDLLTDCAGCQQRHCRECLRSTSDGAVACSNCSAACASDGVVHLTTAMVACALHVGQFLLCKTHATSAACCSRPVCNDHTNLVDCDHVMACSEHAVSTRFSPEATCSLCVAKCASCSDAVPARLAQSCAATSCKAAVCPDHAATRCSTCALSVCPEHVVVCSLTKAVCCPAHASNCAGCESPVRAGLQRPCIGCEKRYCEACLTPVDGGEACRKCTERCAVDSKAYLATSLTRCALEHPSGQNHYCLVHISTVPCCDVQVCPAHRVTVSCVHETACANHAKRVASVNELHCSLCVQDCSVCGDPLLARSTSRCAALGCEAPLCASHADTYACMVCTKSYCPSHAYASTASRGALCKEHGQACERCLTIVSAEDRVPCGDCGAHVCGGCIGTAPPERPTCNECTETCAVDGRAYPRSRTDLCQRHGDVPAHVCVDHLADTPCCGMRVCVHHRAASALSGDDVCNHCASACGGCSCTLAPPDGVACECGARYCDRLEPAPRCVSGEVRCRSHMHELSDRTGFVCSEHQCLCRVCQAVIYAAAASRCAVDGDPVCAKHAIRCVVCTATMCSHHVQKNRAQDRICWPCWGRLKRCLSCDERLRPGMETTCRACSAPMCSEHRVSCSECERPFCASHIAKSPTGDLLCMGCSSACSSCPEGVRHLPAYVVACHGCRAPVCGAHRQSCRQDAEPLCHRCGATSPLVDGVYCASHLMPCVSCGVLAPPVGIAYHLCELCELFSAHAGEAQSLPFDRKVIDDLVSAHGGLLKARARVRWRVGEKFVLVWIRSSILGRDTFQVLDRQGRPSGVCRPAPPAELLR